MTHRHTLAIPKRQLLTMLVAASIFSPIQARSLTFEELQKMVQATIPNQHTTFPPPFAPIEKSIVARHCSIAGTHVDRLGRKVETLSDYTKLRAILSQTDAMPFHELEDGSFVEIGGRWPPTEVNRYRRAEVLKCLGFK